METPAVFPFKSQVRQFFRELNSQVPSAINGQTSRAYGEEFSMRASTYDRLPNKSLLNDGNQF
jgi:hypothetical protein